MFQREQMEGPFITASSTKHSQISSQYSEVDSYTQSRTMQSFHLLRSSSGQRPSASMASKTKTCLITWWMWSISTQSGCSWGFLRDQICFLHLLVMFMRLTHVSSLSMLPDHIKRAVQCIFQAPTEISSAALCGPTVVAPGPVSLKSFLITSNFLQNAPWNSCQVLCSTSCSECTITTLPDIPAC